MKKLGSVYFFSIILAAITILLINHSQLSFSHQLLLLFILAIPTFISEVYEIRINAKGYISVSDAFIVTSIYSGFDLFLSLVFVSILPAEILLRYPRIKEFGWYRIIRAILFNLCQLIVSGYFAYLILQFNSPDTRLLTYAVAFILFVFLNKLINAVASALSSQPPLINAIIVNLRNSIAFDILFSAAIGYGLITLNLIDIRLVMIAIPSVFIVQFLLIKAIKLKAVKSTLESFNKSFEKNKKK